MRYVTSGLAFVLTGGIAFVLAGYFVLPHVPPTPSRPVTVFEGAYWVDNWPGYIAGAAFGGLSAPASLKRTKNQRKPEG